MCPPRVPVGQSRGVSRDFRNGGDYSRQNGSRAPDRAIAAILGRQHRVIHREQLLAIPLSPNQIAYRLRVGRLHIVHPGVYAVGGENLGREGRLVAATLWAGRGAVASHRSAAAVWGILPPGDRIHVTTPERRDPRPGLTLHQRRLPSDEVTIEDGIPVTTVARTLLDIAATEGRRAFDRALRQADYLQLADATPLLDLIARYPGGRGTAVVRAALEARRSSGHTESELENRFVEFIAARGIELPRLNASLEVQGRWVRVDCLWEAERVIVELDGRRAHEGQERREADAERDLLLGTVGYVVVRVTWKRLHEDADGLERDLRSLLAIRRAGVA